MSCTLSPEELSYLRRVLEAAKEAASETTFEEVLLETDNEYVAETERDRVEAEWDALIAKLERGVCPTAREKQMIRNALDVFCTRKYRDMVKRMYPKLRMRWTRQDEQFTCAREWSPIG
jgi:hypothetical protein